MTEEEKRLEEARNRTAHWRRWGPYLSERQWGTVREDYSADGDAWHYFTREQALSRAYRWGEDGIAGISDNHQRLCFSVSLWNGQDPFIKERLFGLSGKEGNHGEDVKECYFYLDNTPTHSYMKFLYKYPQCAFPYETLIKENGKRDRTQGEYELIDTGIFDDDRYFDLFVEYAKNSPDDILIRIHVINRGSKKAVLHLLPTLWFRNTWSWGTKIGSQNSAQNSEDKPAMKEVTSALNFKKIEVSHPTLGKRWFYCQSSREILFTDNETNFRKLFGTNGSSDYSKDGFDQYLVQGVKEAVNPEQKGTKCAAHYFLEMEAQESKTIYLRLTDVPNLLEPFDKKYENVFEDRKREADEFYRRIAPASISEEMRAVQRQAFTGLLWSKQFYHYVVQDWLEGDPSFPEPPSERKYGRNREWSHLYNDDILSMPDKWEYPWFASWDLAFHLVPLAMIDPDFAKSQLTLLTREWYMHPNGQIPAYEWSFSDVNPPVQAWAAWRIYKIEKKMYGRTDRLFLERVFQKLLLNFTWWVNRKDAEGNNIFEGGFLGLDNIGVFNRSEETPAGGKMEQSDGTSWMGMYSLQMLSIALELAKENPSYEDIASKFFEHFLYIAYAMNHLGKTNSGLWDDKDGFYYDVLHLPEGNSLLLKVRSMVGLIPLFAVETLEQTTLDQLPGFKRRFEWFVKNRPDLSANVANLDMPGTSRRRLLSIVNPHQLKRIIEKLADEKEFLSSYGIRALSKFHADHPYIFNVDGQGYRVDYEPAESTSGLFGGNSNWRGPIWFPVNFLLIESLQKFHHYLGDGFKVECPAGSGKEMTLWDVATEISHRLMNIFYKDSKGKRPMYGDLKKFQRDPLWRDYILFYEYFHGDNGTGMGASHQTGWTGLMAKLIQQCGEYCGPGRSQNE